MCDDAGKSSVQASTPKVASSAGDRGTKTDASCENLVKRGHVIGKWPTGDRTRQRGNVRRLARRAPTTISGGKNPVAELADSATNTLKPLERKVTIQVASQVAVAVTLHGDERTPSTACKRAVIWARLNWAVPATRWRLGGILENGAPESCGAETRRRETRAWRCDSNSRDRPAS